MSDIIAELNKVESFTRISDFLQDEDVDFALAQVVKLISNPNAQSVAPILIVQLTAIATKLKMTGKDYMILTKDGSDAAKKKNLYLSLAEAIMELVGSLKYMLRA